MDIKLSLGFLIGCILLVTIYKSKFKGDIGELAVAVVLKDVDKEKYKILHDLKIENPKALTKTSQIDHIIVSTFGIFCIETKGYKGKIYGKETSRQWCQYLTNKKNYFMNPVYQNYGHIKAIETILKNDYPNMTYYSIIAFSGEANLDKVETQNAKVCKIRDLENVIKALSVHKVCDKKDVKKIIQIIESNKSKETDFNHAIDIKRIKKSNKEKIKENICPKCGAKLVEREGKYGKFIGCSNFPKCRFVTKISSDK
ncbi:NERD domain-containing protein [Anaerococcus prevotii]|uniref:Topoisomerase DNA-binding C4 zinc finger domain protein n=1 Tax=Anaerococcus prevotii ACS-065-V-Col13 TaxID=879305 RepID=F0GU29_9FIRM|nr:NERD domain-containing protein [Anaerococcus prevotii]EGC82600.1 topoisomerase DNA-binding C4 zinc finger domain protein [Anaerococcus prevotii ACS-065-V-Col13]